ncbi:sulfite exporter TauE/SafE family protein [Roseomonas marmotae]|uniref:Probable membrane transporter protein n=1 Tax=Roseomonas marmotae TaxID=2768161 RepID=A0ABS3K9W1_9PROT|nr:sulfite exporter TauE/SafE family protein [Roseomonas marmotae]MBO1073428.1 sulfite exporter TauE/SafE family protein [Roseomonas marmotae]QTI80376.1 sulfite exporter TauE/SafE family protein [Roseomonas marmotae]
MQHLSDPVWLLALAAAMAFTGIVSGTLAGLLGVGGGIVIVPVLFNVFPLFGIPEALQMKLAVGTSLATIIPTSIVSARKHQAKGAIDGNLLRAIWPSMIIGVALGTVLAIWLHGDALSAVFAVIALLVAVNMGFTGVDFKIRDITPRGPGLWGIGGFIGAISAMMGIGGGTVGVPILSMFGTPIRSAVATASVFGLIISIPATAGFIYGGLGVQGLPPFSVGYVNLIGFALIVPSSILATPWGVHLAHTIPPLMLKRAFALFLAITAVRMFYSLLT